MRFFFFILFPGILLIGLSSCFSQPTPLPLLPTDTISPSQTPTPTIVWFPATATYTPLPTITAPVTPTVYIEPVYGSLILADDFSDPTLWTLGRTSMGNLALGENELTLVVTQPEGYLFSLRKDTILRDFYLEITASPSICRGEDEYGLLLRVSPSLDLYRFSLSCNGQARVDRLLAGQASSPQPPTWSWAIPPGAPSTSRLAVWAAGKEMRFYANDTYLFTVQDPVLRSGGFGVFTRAAGEDSVTVNFSKLEIYETSE